MNLCLDCEKHIKDGHKLSCPNCGTSFCLPCAEKSKRICPKCYHNLEFSE